MTADAHPWTVRLTKTAESDYQSIIVWTLIVWTLREFGDQQARIYADALSAALVALTAGPTTVGAKERSEIGKGLYTLHVARGGHKGRHFVLFRVGPDKHQRHIEVLRLLHDAMDLTRHIPGA
ncbi:MAG: toxin ParE1/3/4 [Gammaproteobacteria bacterium]|jgi:toxin ParE1/3/4|nr:toxin ParE1/3/4 [Gammaproteobacteria bacterium]